MGRGMVKKMQIALKSKNFEVTIPQTQFFKKENGLLINVYHIKYGKRELFRTSSQIKVIKYLADLIKVVGAASKETFKDRDERDKYIFKEMEEYAEKTRLSNR